MYLQVGPDDGSITLVRPEDCTRLHVQLTSVDLSLARESFAASGTGVIADDGTAAVDPGALRRMAAGNVPAGWETRFDEMLDYARRHGWVDGDGRVQAHIEQAR
jgi:hypothetical protein